MMLARDPELMNARCDIRDRKQAVPIRHSASKDQNATLSRRDQKLQLVRTRGQVSFDELAHHFPVSDDTIRRDLQALE
jgi:hypothetical protein